jgi:hypothetical protein
MLVADIAERARTALVAADQALYRETYLALAELATAEPSPEADAVAITRQLQMDVATGECAWALLVGQWLWRSGCQAPTDFDNQRQFSQFGAASRKFSRIEIAGHEALALQAAAAHPSPAVFVLLGNVRRFLHRYGAAEDAYLEGLQRFPGDPFLKLRLADLHLATYRLPQAHALLRQLQPLYPYARQMMFLVPRDSGARVPPLMFPPLSCGDKPLVWLVAADPVYMERYATALADSVRAATNRVHMHFHVLGDWQAPLAAATKRAIQAAAPGAVLSERQLDLATAPPHWRKALFASERFLILAELLEKYATPMLVTDIDVRCLKEPLELLERLGERELGYTNFKNTLEAWERYAATALLVRPTPAAIEFFRNMAGLLLSTLDSHPQPWFNDQIALFRLIEEFPSQLRCAFLEHILTDTEPPSPKGYFQILHGSWQG